VIKNFVPTGVTETRFASPLFSRTQSISRATIIHNGGRERNDRSDEYSLINYTSNKGGSNGNRMTEAASAAVVATSSMDVQQEAPRLDTISFAVSLPAAVFSSQNEPETTRSLPGDERGIVGTIVFMKKSVMIWFGWGQLVPEETDGAATTTDATPNMTRSVGRGTLLYVLKLVVNMYTHARKARAVNWLVSILRSQNER
jgi:hypothetical protein